MHQLLKSGTTVRAQLSGMGCVIEQFLGGGGQGEVYQARLGGKAVAVKWYFPHYLNQDDRLKERLETAVNCGAPSDRFLWPSELVTASGATGFGYLMPLREARFKSIVDLMAGRADPTFRALATAGYELANSYYQLHARGLCYRDISFGNIFFDPTTGEVRICDNDNVDVDGKPGVIGGTPDFMAPEIVEGTASPSARTDLFSLSVLLFYMFHIHHPLQGKRMMTIHSWDLPARRKVLGGDALFIFDPVNRSNEAVSRAVDPTGEAGENALNYWPIYPQFLRDRFTTAFVQGLHDPDGRVGETFWRADMVRLRDAVIYCPQCRCHNFYDTSALKAPGGLKPCWKCRGVIPLPPRIRIGKHVVMLNFDAQLFPHHLEEQNAYDFSHPVAVLSKHPTNSSVWGLKNLSGRPWTAVLPDASVRVVETERTMPLLAGTRINFGGREGEIAI